MLRTSTQSFRHLEHQSPTIISGDIGRARSVQQFQNGGTEWNGGMEQNGGTEQRSTVVLDDRMSISCIIFIKN